MADGALAPLEYLVGVQTSVDSVRHDALTRLEGESLVVEEDLDRSGSKETKLEMRATSGHACG